MNFNINLTISMDFLEEEIIDNNEEEEKKKESSFAARGGKLPKIIAER